MQFAPVRAAAYAKLHQRASHYAIVGVAAALDVKGGVIESARIGLTGAGPSAVRLTNVEQALAGKTASKETIAGRRHDRGRRPGARSTPTSTPARTTGAR